MNEPTPLGIATGASRNPEVITKFEPAFLATTTRLLKEVQITPFVKDLPKDMGGKFELMLPDVMPAGSTVVVYWVNADRKSTVETFKIIPRINGKMVVEPTAVDESVQTYINKHVTGETHGVGEANTVLTPIAVNDDISSLPSNATPFLKLNIISSRPQQDYYKVAVATPSSLSKIR